MPSDGGLLDYLKSKITDPTTGVGKGTPPVGTGGRQRQKTIDDSVDAQSQDQGDDKLGRMRQAQSTDRDNSYSY